MLKRFIFIAVFMMSAGYAGAVNVNELNPEFFTRFNDDCLVYYINQAIENNHNAKQATYQVEQYRQQAKYSLGKELPSFSVSARSPKLFLLMLFLPDQMFNQQKNSLKKQKLMFVSQEKNFFRHSILQVSGHLIQ